MEDHVHMGILFILSVAAAIALINSTVRVVVLHHPNSAVSKALTFVYG